MRIITIVVAAFASLALVAGCGSSSSNDTLSYSDFGSQASTICQDGSDAVKGITDPKEFGPKIQPFLDKIKDLKAPDELKAAQDEFVSITEDQIAAADAGDIAKVQELSAQSDAAGSKMGAPACATQG